MIFDRRACLALPLVGLVLASVSALAQPAPLPSWNAGPVKQSITGFVERVTREGGPDFVPPAERIATFDNDGTLWAEQPMYFQLAFALDRVKAMAPANPEWATTQPFKAVLDNDLPALLAGGEKGLVAMVAATHAGMTTEAFNAEVAEWPGRAEWAWRGRPPSTGRPG